MRRDSQEAFEPAVDPSYEDARARGWSDERLIQTFEPMLSPARLERLQAVVAGRLSTVTVLMDAPHDPHNGAAIVRTCDALGIQYLHVVPREEAFLAARTVTKGSEQWVDVFNHRSPKSAVEALRAQGFTLVGSHPTGRLVPNDLASIPKLALVLGNEHDGICAELEGSVDSNVGIPMRGFAESLNVSVCAAILLSRATEGRSGDLAGHERRTLYARWLLQSVSRADEIVVALS